MVSAARAAYRGSDASRERLCRGRTPVRPTTRRPAVSTSRSSSSRVRGPRCSAGSDRISRPSPPGRRCCPRPARNPPGILLSSSYTPSSRAAVGRPGQPRRIADGEIGAAGRGAPARIQPRSHRDPPVQPEPPGAVPGPVDGARAEVRSHHPADAAPGRHGREDPGAGAQVERDGRGRVAPCRRRQGSVRHEVDVLAPGRREDAVVGMDACAERGRPGSHPATPGTCPRGRGGGRWWRASGRRRRWRGRWGRWGR